MGPADLRMLVSLWPSMSMKPGAMAFPPASTIASRGAVEPPDGAIRPPLIATSPADQGAPVPSMIRPSRKRRS